MAQTNQRNARRYSYRSAPADKAAVGIFSGIALFWILWLAVKVVALPVLIVNICYLVTAIQNGAVGTFDFTWLIVSFAAFIVL